MLARCDESGKLVDDGGRVEVRYRPNDGKAYRAAARNLEPVPGTALFPDDHCAEAAPVAEKAATASQAKSGAVKKQKAGPEAVDPSFAPRAIAYTDGACSGNPGPSGLGVVLLRGEERRELSEYLGVGTNNIAELTAILRALELLEELGEAEEPVLIHTDSQYAIGILQKNWKPKANQELVHAIRTQMKPFKKLKLVYVPGHAGVPLNERADALARKAVSDRDSTGWREVQANHGQAHG